MESQEVKDETMGITPPEEPEAPSSNGDQPVEDSPAMRRDPQRLFRYSGYLHVGDGAEECPDGENGRCKNPDHFHCWVRLPNKLQVKSIHEKAAAAKARKRRLLLDENADAHWALEGDLDLLAEVSAEELVEELLQRKRFSVHMDAVRVISEDEKYETIEEDQERFRVLDAKQRDDQEDEEYQELVRHLDGWNEAIDAKRAELESPEKEALSQKSREELISMIRKDRIESASTEAYMASFSQWQMLVCTLKPRDAEKGRPSDRIWGSVEEMRESAPPEVIDTLNEMFGELEGDLLSRAAPRAEGN